MTQMRIPSLSLFHVLSAVSTGALSAIPKARHAQSPSERPRCRVRATRLPAILACSSLKGTASRMGLVVSSHASSEAHPRLTSLACTSARLTVLPTAMASSSGVSFSRPGSPLMTARIAEASSTILFILGCLAAFGEQLIDQRHAGFYILPGAALGPLNAPLLGRDSQLIVLDPQHNFISNLNAKRLTECRRNNDATVFVDALADFLIHVTLHYR